MKKVFSAYAAMWITVLSLNGWFPPTISFDAVGNLLEGTTESGISLIQGGELVNGRYVRLDLNSHDWFSYKTFKQLLLDKLNNQEGPEHIDVVALLDDERLYFFEEHAFMTHWNKYQTNPVTQRTVPRENIKAYGMIYLESGVFSRWSGVVMYSKALFDAIFRNDHEFVQRYCENNDEFWHVRTISCNGKDEYETTLGYAEKCKHHDIVEYLWRHMNYQVNTLLHGTMTSLYWGVSFGSDEFVHWVLDQSQDGYWAPTSRDIRTCNSAPKRGDKKLTPFYVALEKKRFGIARTILEHPYVNKSRFIQGYRGITILEALIRNLSSNVNAPENAEILSLLDTLLTSQHGSDDYMHNALFYALWGPDWFMKRLLNLKTWDLDMKDEHDDSLLMRAVTWGNVDVKKINILLKAGAQIRQRAAGNRTLLMRAAEVGGPWPERSRIAIFRRLLKEPEIEIDAQDDMGMTALGLAVYTRKVEYVDILLNAGADPNISRINGKTLLDHVGDTAQNHGAYLQGDDVMIERFLRECGARSEASDSSCALM